MLGGLPAIVPPSPRKVQAEKLCPGLLSVPVRLRVKVLLMVTAGLELARVNVPFTVSEPGRVEEWSKRTVELVAMVKVFVPAMLLAPRRSTKPIPLLTSPDRSNRL